MNPTIMTVSGNYFDFTNPHESKFDIVDIAFALSNICRFTGHCRSFYSVAQHSVLVSQVVPKEFALEGLLHDAPEAFIGDVAKPLKILLPDYQKIEAQVEDAVLSRFGITQPLPPCVKKADRILLRTEQRDLMNATGEEWELTKDYEPLPEKIVPMSSADALVAFLARFQYLMGAKCRTSN